MDKIKEYLEEQIEVLDKEEANEPHGDIQRYLRGKISALKATRLVVDKLLDANHNK